MLQWFKKSSQQKSADQEYCKPIKNTADSTVIKFGDAEAFDLFGALPTDSGAVVNAKTAMRISAVYACVSLIAGALAMMSYPVYRRTEKGKERATHAYQALLNEQACPEFTSASMWEFVVTQMLLRGDALCYLHRVGPEVRSVIPIPRGHWVVDRDDAPQPGMPGRLKYAINFEEGYRGVQQEDVLHFPGFGFDGLEGMSVIQWGARAASGIAIQGDRWAGKFFGRGAQPAHAVRAPGQMTTEQQDEFRQAWEKAYGGKGPTGRPLILTEGLDIEELSMSAKDAQMLEARQWQVVDIARAFRVPPHLVGETTPATSWGSGIQQMSVGFSIYTLGPHVNRIKQELNRKLFSGTDYFIEPDQRVLMRGDDKARAEYYKTALGGTQQPGWMEPNEVREKENLPPHEDGGGLSKPDPTQEPQSNESQ